MFIVYLVSQYDRTTRDKEFESLESVHTPDYRKLTGVECLCSLSHSGDLSVSPCPSHVSNSSFYFCSVTEKEEFFPRVIFSILNIKTEYHI